MFKTGDRVRLKKHWAGPKEEEITWKIVEWNGSRGFMTVDDGEADWSFLSLVTTEMIERADCAPPPSADDRRV